MRLSGSDYQQAFQNPDICFTDPALQKTAPKKNPLGLPALMSGNFAVVCKFEHGEQAWAVRGFVKDVPDIRERYERISSYLDAVSQPSTALVGFRYLSEGLRVSGRLYPIVVMDWVPGTQLHRAIDLRITRRESLQLLIASWVHVLGELNAVQIAHGDLQHGNVLVDGDAIRLVDYDGMFVPTMRGLPSADAGHPNYQHPRRDQYPYDQHGDRFSGLLILTAMKAIEADPTLWSRYDMPDECLLFRRGDLIAPDESPLFEQLLESADREVARLTEALYQSLVTGELPPPITEILSTTTVVVTSTRNTDGWWRQGAQPQHAGQAAGSPNPGSSIGSGWVRAFVGTPAHGGTLGDSAMPLDQVPFVASFNRPYVHASDCDWARMISKRNLIGFPTLEDALASGYKPCKTCRPNQLRHDLPVTESAEPIHSDDQPDQQAVSKLWHPSKVRQVLQGEAAGNSRSSTSRPRRANAVSVGCQVRVKHSGGRVSLLRIVPADASTPTASHVAEDTPLGRALLGKTPGDTVVYQEVGRWYRLTVLEVL